MKRSKQKGVRHSAKTRVLRLFKKASSLFPYYKTLSAKKRQRYLRLGILSSVGAFLFVYIFWGLPLPTSLSSTDYPVSTKIYDRNGELIYEIFAEKRRTPIKLEELPPYVAQATIAIEDKDFYKHYGFSPTGVVRATYNIVFRQKFQGGSTITQQLVKTALLTPERTLRRKVREFLLSLVAETIYSKDQILEMYLNQVPYGGTAWGIEAAAQSHFGKSARDLTLPEAALLAGLPAAPTRFSPFGTTPELAKGRQQAVLRRMVEDGYITTEEADEAAEVELVFEKPQGIRAPHFALWIKEQLVERYGLRTVEQGGLIVKTTLDLEIQEFAQDVVATEVARLKNQQVGNGAALVVHPSTGQILAMVGSKDYFAEDEDGKVNVTLARRQPGSAIKPINYALAFLRERITPATVINDVPTCFSVVGQPLYCPQNYDVNFHGAVQVRFALGNSYNLPAVKVLALNGLEEFIDLASKMGITTFGDPSDYGLSLTLGGGEVKMVDMGVAFGTLFNGGVRQDLVSILEVKDSWGKVLEEYEFRDGDRVLPAEVTFLVLHILLDNNARSAAFGESSFLVVGGHPEVSVKTGTTQNLRDNWAIGGSSDALVLSWVGNNDNTEMSGAVSGVSGASPIWNRIIRFALNRIEAGEVPDLADSSEEHPHRWPLQPERVVGAAVCVTSGLAPPGPEDNPGCATRFEFFIEGTAPTEAENLNRQVPIDKTTGQVARPETPPENIEIQEHPVIIDLWGTIFCLDCPFPTEPIVLNPAALPQSLLPLNKTSEP